MLRPGEAFGPYRIEGLIGVGGQASVYRALQQSLDREVALKVLPPESQAGLRARFRRETRIHTALQHPNLVKVLDVGFVAETPYLAMELVSGGTLDAVMKRDELLAVERVRRWLVDLAAALGYLHGKGLVHRDLKPANVLLGTADAAKIADFGLARGKEHTMLTQAGHMVGTLIYLAPEAFSESEPGPAMDAYALGLIAYELLARRRPHRAETFESYLRMLVSTDPEPVTRHRPDVPEDLTALVMRLLDRDPARRAGVDEVALLDAAGATRRLTRRTPGATPRVSRPIRPVRLPATSSSPRPSPRGGRPLAVIAVSFLAVAAGLALRGLVGLPGTSPGPGPGRPGLPGASRPGPGPDPVPVGAAASPGEESQSAARARAELGHWHHRLYFGLDPGSDRREVDGRFWVRLMMNLARATRAPLPGLDRLEELLLEAPRAPRGRDATRLLEILAGSVREQLGTFSGRARDLLASPDKELDGEDLMNLHEVLTVLRVADRVFAAWEIAGDPLVGPDPRGSPFERGRTAPFRSVPRRVTRTQGWKQVRTYLHPVGSDPETVKASDVLGLNQPFAIGVLDGKTGPGGRRLVPMEISHLGQDPIPMRYLDRIVETVPVTGEAGPPAGAGSRWRLDIRSRIIAGDRTILTPADLIWVTLEGRLRILIDVTCLDPGEPLIAAQWIPARTLGGRTEIAVELRRELVRRRGADSPNPSYFVRWMRIRTGPDRPAGEGHPRGAPRPAPRPGQRVYAHPGEDRERDESHQQDAAVGPERSEARDQDHREALERRGVPWREDDGHPGVGAGPGGRSPRRYRAP